MRKGTSVYLDFLRLAAAVGVLLYHSQHFVSLPVPSLLIDQGAECVCVFFVLSGFVIRYVSVEREQNWRDYARARIARIYPVAILSIATTLVVDTVGIKANPNAYVDQGYFNPHFGLLDFASAFTFTNEVWFRHVIIGSDEPYWSLGFEVPYYVLFALWIFGKRNWRVVLVIIWAAIFGPKILLYLPVWLMGVFAYNLTSSNWSPPKPKLMGVILLASSVGIYALAKYVLRIGHPPMFLLPSLQSLVHGAAYYWTVGFAASVNIVGFDLISRRAEFRHDFVPGAIRWLAGGSFTLYLMHLPLLQAMSALIPSIAHNALLGDVAVGAVFGATLLLAEIGERRKQTYRRLAARII